MDQFGQAAGALIHRWALALPPRSTSRRLVVCPWLWFVSTYRLSEIA